MASLVLNGGVEDLFPELSEGVSGFVVVIVVEVVVVVVQSFGDLQGQDHGVSHHDVGDVGVVQVSEHHGLVQILVEGAVLVGGFDISIHSQWAVEHNVVPLSSVQEVENSFPPGVNRVDQFVGHVEAVRVCGEHKGVFSVGRSLDESVPPGGWLFVSDFFVFNVDTSILVFAGSESGLVVGLDSSLSQLWSSIEHVHLSRGWMDEVLKVHAVLGVQLGLHLTESLLRGFANVLGLSEGEENSGKEE